MRNSNKDLVRLWKLQAKVNMLVLDGKRDPKRVADAFQEILEQSDPKFELYLYGCQTGVVTGHDLLKHLEETGRIKRVFSLENPIVKRWIEIPETYPKNFQDSIVVLWGSRRKINGEDFVACLVFRGGRVIEEWYSLKRIFTYRTLALLALEEQNEALQGQASHSL